MIADRTDRLALVLHVAAVARLSGTDLRQLAALLDVADEVRADRRAAGSAIAPVLAGLAGDDTLAAALDRLPEAEREVVLDGLELLGLHLEDDQP